MARSQADESIRHYSRKARPVGTLASQVRLLMEFANLRDEDVERFRAQHQDFFVPSSLTDDGWVEGVVHRLGAGGPKLIDRRALAHAEALAKMQPNPALRKRDILRFVWSGDPAANDYLKLLLWGSRVEFDWKRGEITYEPQDEFERAVYTLFRNSSLAKVCAKPDCPAPYFIGKRATQRYCSPDCAVLFQEQWKRNWWKRVGSKRRQEQRAAKRKKQRKEGGQG